MTGPIHCRACPFAGCIWCSHQSDRDDTTTDTEDRKEG